MSEELRAAAIEHVRRLRELHGGRIPSAVLNQGMVVHGTRIPIWNQQKGIFKPASFGLAGALSVQTSARSPYGDEHDLSNGRITYKYRGSDPAHPDNVALRRAFWAKSPIIYFVAVDPGYYDAVMPVYVVGDDPGSLQFSMVADQLFAGANVTAPDIEDAAKTAARREYATRAVLVRLHQHQFRRTVLMAYGNRCAICRLGHVRLLDAAHILPDKDPLGEPLVSNGLGLCKIHHSAYDARIIGIDSDARVHVNEDVLQEKDGPMLRHGLQEVHSSKLTLPRRVEERPNREYLAMRFELFLSA